MTTITAPAHVDYATYTREYMDKQSYYTLDEIAPRGAENVDLMREVLTYAADELRKRSAEEDYRPRFNMDQWFEGDLTATTDGPPPLACGTAACLAGTAAAFTMKPGDHINWAGLRRKDADYRVDIAHVGRHALGLTIDQAGVLFHMTDHTLDLADIVAVASYITGTDLRDTLAGTAAAPTPKRSRLARLLRRA